jgi:hypothetical protein
MANIGDDLLIHLYGFIPYQDRHVLAKTDKFFKELFQKDIANIILIQRFFQKYKIDNEYMLNAGLEKYKNYNPNLDYNDWNDNLIHRYYMAKYEDRFLKPYPEFLVGKAINDPIKKQQALNWIQNNLDSDPNKRSRRDIYNFFKENNITSEELIYTGW